MEAVFDHAAVSYDELFSTSEIGKLQRDIVWNYLKSLPKENKPLTVLELNCGTGIDAVFLAQEGYNVLATDLSGKMLEIAQGKANQSGLQSNISFKKASIEELILNENTLKGQQFDLIFSNFGGLNCLSPESFSRLLTILPSLMQSQGRFVAVIMPNMCFMESLYFMLKLDLKSAFRRLSKGSVKAQLGDVVQTTWYYSPTFLKKGLRSEMKEVNRKAVGLFIPPSYLEPFFKSRKKLLNIMKFWDRKFSRWNVFSHISDHFLIDFIKIQ